MTYSEASDGTRRNPALQSNAREHSLALNDRARLDLSGVTDVRGFNDTVILLTTSAGDLTVRGETLHIDGLDLDTGTLAVTGRISSLAYSDPPVTRGLFARLFGD